LRAGKPRRQDGQSWRQPRFLLSRLESVSSPACALSPLQWLSVGRRTKGGSISRIRGWHFWATRRPRMSSPRSRSPNWSTISFPRRRAGRRRGRLRVVSSSAPFRALALCAGAQQSPAGGALLGGLGAVAGTLGGYELRTRLVRALQVPDFVIALLEDAVAICGGFFLVSRF